DWSSDVCSSDLARRRRDVGVHFVGRLADVATPDVAATEGISDIASTHVAAPDIATSDVAAPDVATPDITAPHVTAPDVAATNVEGQRSQQEFAHGIDEKPTDIPPVANLVQTESCPVIGCRIQQRLDAVEVEVLRLR